MQIFLPIFVEKLTVFLIIICQNIIAIFLFIGRRYNFGVFLQTSYYFFAGCHHFNASLHSHVPVCFISSLKYDYKRFRCI